MDEVEQEERRPTPYVTYILLLSLVFIHTYISVMPPEMTLEIYETYSLFPVRIFNGVAVDAVVTYLFLHGNWVHLFVNCIALVGSGIIVERDIGHKNFTLAFLASGIVSGLAHSVLHLSSSIPLIGASGAIFGIIAVLFLLMPFKITYALVIPLPSVIVGIMLSLVELYSLWAPTDITIAHDAHISGFIVGCIYAFMIDRKRALKGLLIALTVLTIMYYVGIRYDVI
ncbi:MAG: rhomboid family intramembrane serine protease [Candidatus Bathyarchaeota archaeon]|jgi:membrane associated rhomboid family serine protease